MSDLIDLIPVPDVGQQHSNFIAAELGQNIEHTEDRLFVDLTPGRREAAIQLQVDEWATVSQVDCSSESRPMAFLDVSSVNVANMWCRISREI